ncbi:hypothetical protein [Terasakiella brassicae]|uniref:hypothetical protein n=1 Tax=Terasakiella brassicae TaxID=1634917 RepID=UPI0016683DAE|nr:hypothetical protein [Terasakiella brassicae]
MIIRLLCLIGFVFTLSGCLQGTFVTIVDGNGDYQNLARVKTNIVSFAAIADRLNNQGIRYKQQMLEDGKVQGEWEPTFGASEYSCHGIFLKECQMNLNLPVNLPDMVSQMIVMEAKKKGDPEEMLTVSYIVVLPESARVKSTNAHNQYVDEDGLNLEWSFTPDPGDVLRINFKAGI